MERADQVLSLWNIDAGFAADGAVHLCQQACGDLCEVHATAQHACSKAGQVADHAAAKGNDQIAAFDARIQQVSQQGLKLIEVFRLLTSGQNERL